MLYKKSTITPSPYCVFLDIMAYIRVMADKKCTLTTLTLCGYYIKA